MHKSQTCHEKEGVDAKRVKICDTWIDLRDRQYRSTQSFIQGGYNHSSKVDTIIEVRDNGIRFRTVT